MQKYQNFISDNDKNIKKLEDRIALFKLQIDAKSEIYLKELARAKLQDAVATIQESLNKSREHGYSDNEIKKLTGYIEEVKMDFDNKINPDDQEFEDKGIKLVTDLRSFLYVCNTTLEPTR